MSDDRQGALRDRLASWREAMERVEPEIRSFVDTPRRDALIDDELAAVPADGPLAGVLLGVKDIFHVDGWPTRAGSRLPAGELAGPEAPAVSALVAAGALVVGKTVTTEFAYFAPGPTRNPRAPGRTPGGSSSGSAAAVAAGLCDLALGTQTIGSIGRPAAFCGIVGYKPSYDRIPREGVIPLAPSVDHVGLFARTVAEIASAAAVCVREWTSEGRAVDPSRLGVVTGPYLEQLSVEGREHFAGVRERLRRRGLSLVEVDAMPDFGTISARHRRLVAAEAAAVHADWFARFAELYAEKTAELIRTGQGVSADELAAALAGRAELRERFDAVAEREGIDLWISPPAVGPAPLGLESTGDPVMNLPWTHAGMPAVVVPAGATTGGLPMGLQIAARFGEDERLVAAAAVLEDVVG